MNYHSFLNQGLLDFEELLRIIQEPPRNHLYSVYGRTSTQWTHWAQWASIVSIASDCTPTFIFNGHDVSMIVSI